MCVSGWVWLEMALSLTTTLSHIVDQQDLVDFTDEEGYGKFLDLHHLYDQFINLKQVEKVDYLTYIVTFDRMFEIAKDKKNSEYKRLVSLYSSLPSTMGASSPSLSPSRYVTELLEYLSSYLEKIHPLTDQQTILEEVKKDFEDRWTQGNFPGWRVSDTSLLDQ